MPSLIFFPPPSSVNPSHNMADTTERRSTQTESLGRDAAARLSALTASLGERCGPRETSLLGLQHARTPII